jgi:predicted HTH domain antitoxin
LTSPTAWPRRGPPPPPDEAEQEVREELPLTLYARQLLPLGKARQLAGLSRRDFEALLGERQIPRHYSEEELEEDLDYAFGDVPPSEEE